MDKKDLLQHYLTRRNRMRGQRSKFEAVRDMCDRQVEAQTYYDNSGKFIVNVPMEQNLIEMSMGRNPGNINFNVEPNGKADVDMIQPAKYALEYFLELGDFYRENRQFNLDKCTYGTGIFFSGIRQKDVVMYDLPEVIDSIRTEKMKEYRKKEYIFSPCNVPIRSFWIDDRAIFQPDWNKVEDCIRQEELTKDEIIARRGEEGRGVDELQVAANQNPGYGFDNQMTPRIIVHHYYNKNTKDYCIVANYAIIIFASKMFNRDGNLPFCLAQHYPVNNCIYGRGIPDKVRYIKAYKNHMMQGALDLVSMSKGVNLGIGNDGVVSGQLYTGMGEMNIRSFNTGMDNVKQFNLDSNISPMVNVMQMIDDFVIQDTGENIKAPYSSPAGTLGEVEIIEQNKALRVKTIDESRDICLDYVLSQVLSNIANFAPKVLCQKEDDKGKVKITYPMISVKNSKVESKRGKIEVTEDYGKYGFFELKPQTISDQMKVKVTTFSTRTALKAIAKDEFTQFIQNVTAIAQLDPQMLQKINFDGVLDLMNTIYQYDDKMSATTVKDEIKKKNLQIMESIKALTGLPQGEGTPQAQDVFGQQPDAGAPQGQPEQPQQVQAPVGV